MNKHKCVKQKMGVGHIHSFNNAHDPAMSRHSAETWNKEIGYGPCPHGVNKNLL